ncbi:MAG: hypothetical protein A2033_17075 [Bacteroidetes bacterium GWA2_31_9]|nr:MAG: hypothetical protein A2033_17075 [Bacteroidetes bacterium GWA2_31_9]
MNSNLKNIINTLVGLFIGLIFLYITFHDKPIDEIFDSIKNANIYWLLVNGLLLFIVMYLRAIRWKIIIENSGYTAENIDIMNSTVLGFFVNSFTPKIGEITRCTTIYRTSKVPFSVSFGTIVIDRIWDMVILLLGILAVFSLEIEKLKFIKSHVIKNILNLFSNNSNLIIWILIIGSLLTIILIILLYKFHHKIALFSRILSFITNTYDTIKKSIKLKKFNSFFLITLVIWILLILMNYTCLLALPETDNYSFYFATVVLFIGGLGWAMPTPGGIGTTHFLILQLFIAYNLDPKTGLSFAVLSNGITFVYTIIFGLISWPFYEIRRRKVLKNNKI